MDKYKKVAELIKETYEKNLFTLKLECQSHFSRRIYRISGQKRYIQPIVNSYQCIEIQIEYFLKVLENKKYITIESQKEFKKIPNTSKKDMYRKKIFSKKHKEILLFACILSKIDSCQSSNIKKKDREKIIFILKKKSLKKYFTDNELIKCFGTQLINAVYSLKKLKIIDYIKDFTTEYKEIFMDVDDKMLEDFEYQNKIYGLTHFILVESDYYQKWVSKKKFEWILDYFYLNINQIIKRTNSDIIAEVGLCFMLCRSKQDKILKKVKEYLAKEFNSDLGYIPRGERKELGISEHTNIIAYMVLNGIKRLYAGPDLSKFIE